MASLGCGPLPVATLLWASPPSPTPAPTFSPPPLLLVPGSTTLRSAAGRVRLRGVNVCSLEFDHEGTTWALSGEGSALLERLADPLRWKANVVRMPVNQQWFNEDDEYVGRVERLIDDAARRGLYVLLDVQWERSGRTDPYDANILRAPTFGAGNTTEAFWLKATSRWANRSNLLLDLLNEPHGQPEPAQREALQTLVDAIRVRAKEVLLVIGGPDWAHSIEPWAKQPLLGEGLLYSAHQYLPYDEVASFEAKWAAPAARVPALVGEFLADEAHLDFARQLIDTAEASEVNGWLPWAIGCGLPEDESVEPAKTIAEALRRLN
jgi:hypothetical protein